MRAWPAILALAAGSILAACSQSHLPKGVDESALSDNISGAIGDPNTCVLIGEPGSGKVAFRYNTHEVCNHPWPACDGARSWTVDDLLKATAKDGQPRRLSCTNPADGRVVGWASGVIAGKGLPYAAVMEGNRAFPGRMMADRLEGAFQDSGL